MWCRPALRGGRDPLDCLHFTGPYQASAPRYSEVEQAGLAKVDSGQPKRCTSCVSESTVLLYGPVTRLARSLFKLVSVVTVKCPWPAWVVGVWARVLPCDRDVKVRLTCRPLHSLRWRRRRAQLGHAASLPMLARAATSQEHPSVARVKAKARTDLQAKRTARSELIQPWKDWNWGAHRSRQTPGRPSASHPTSSGQVVEQQAGPAVQEIDKSDEEDGAGNTEESKQKEVAAGHSPHSSDGGGSQQVIVSSPHHPALALSGRTTSLLPLANTMTSQEHAPPSTPAE
eukprot:462724-Prymnesium_polylepis.1